jgi:hypothetical protein
MPSERRRAHARGVRKRRRAREKREKKLLLLPPLFFCVCQVFRPAFHLFFALFAPNEEREPGYCCALFSVQSRSSSLQFSIRRETLLSCCCMPRGKSSSTTRDRERRRKDETMASKKAKALPNGATPAPAALPLALAQQKYQGVERTGAGFLLLQRMGWREGEGLVSGCFDFFVFSATCEKLKTSRRRLSFRR